MSGLFPAFDENLHRRMVPVKKSMYFVWILAHGGSIQCEHRSLSYKGVWKIRRELFKKKRFLTEPS